MDADIEGQSRALEYDKQVRNEAKAAFVHVRKVENRLKLAPEGYLGVSESLEAQAMRATMISSAASIVATFSKFISLLSSPPTLNRSKVVGSSALEFPRAAQLGKTLDKNVMSGSSNDESPISTANNSESPTHSPRRIHLPSLLLGSSPDFSPCHTPLSGISEGSPIGNVNPSTSPGRPETEIEAAGPTRRNTEAGTSTQSDLVEQRPLSKKRKFMPKYTCKQHATGSDQGNDGPPDDGHTWRKYGQKDILGSRYPRSYYRCTHKSEFGCPAIKYVQRSDDDTTIFDVTYRGTHSCQSILQRPPWPFSLQQIAMALQGSQLHPVDNTAPSCLMQNSVAALHENSTCQTQVIPSAEELMKGLSSFPQSASSLQLPPLASNYVLQRSTPPVALNSLMPQRFGMNPNSPTRLESQQHSIMVKMETDPTQQASNQGRASRDNLFCSGSNLLNLLLANTQRPSERDCSMNVEDAPNAQIQTQRRGELDISADLALTNSGRAGKHPAHQYVEKWVDGLGLQDCCNEFMSSQHGTDDISKHFEPSPATSETMSTQQLCRSRPTSVMNLSIERVQTLPNPECDGSEVVAEHTPRASSPFAMGYMMDSPVHQHQNMMFNVMEYETFNSSMMYGASQTDQPKYM